MPIDSNSKWKHVEISEAEALKAYAEGESVIIGYEPDECPGFTNPTVFQSIQEVLFDSNGKLHHVELDATAIEINRNDIKHWFILTPDCRKIQASYRETMFGK